MKKQKTIILLLLFGGLVMLALPMAFAGTDITMDGARWNKKYYHGLLEFYH